MKPITALPLLALLASPALSADLHCTTVEICEGGSDCAPAAPDAEALGLKDWDGDAPRLVLGESEFEARQTKAAPIWRWSAASDDGGNHVLAWREADSGFTYLVIAEGKTQMKTSGTCEVR